MRINRSKMVRKYLQFYRLTYGIKPPFNLILDGNFIFAAFKNKIDIKERVQRVLQGEEVRYYVLKSVIDELRSVGEKAAEALQFALTCFQLDDSRINGVTPTDKTIGFLRAERAEASAAGTNGGRPRRQFFVATQDRELRGVLGSLSGFPLLYLNQVTLVMEPPSRASKTFNMEAEEEKSKLNEEEKQILEMISKTEATKVPEPPKERVKRKATAPNPLSSQKAQEESSRTKKRKLNAIRRAHA